MESSEVFVACRLAWTWPSQVLAVRRLRTDTSNTHISVRIFAQTMHSSEQSSCCLLESEDLIISVSKCARISSRNSELETFEIEKCSACLDWSEWSGIWIDMERKRNGLSSKYLCCLPCNLRSTKVGIREFSGTVSPQILLLTWAVGAPQYFGFVMSWSVLLCVPKDRVAFAAARNLSWGPSHCLLMSVV